MSSFSSLNAGWRSLFADFRYTHAVSLAYNPQCRTTAAQCFRAMPERAKVAIPTPLRVSEYLLPASSEALMLRVQKDLDFIHGRIDRRFLGARFHLLPSARRSSFVGCVEHVASNAHIHLLWNLPVAADNITSRLASEIDCAWMRAAPRGTTVVETPHDHLGWASYVMKELWTPADFDRVVFSRGVERA